MASRVAHSACEPVPVPARLVSPAQKRRAIAKWGGQCSFSGCTTRAGLEVDHIIARGLGGPNADHNLAPLCTPHHAAKTRLDRKLIAKANRILKREAGEKKRGRPINGRGFEKGLTRGFDNVVRRR